MPQICVFCAKGQAIPEYRIDLTPDWLDLNRNREKVIKLTTGCALAIRIVVYMIF